MSPLGSGPQSRITFFHHAEPSNEGAADTALRQSISPRTGNREEGTRKLDAYQRIEARLVKAAEVNALQEIDEAEEIILSVARSARKCADQTRPEIGEAYLAAAMLRANRVRHDDNQYKTDMKAQSLLMGARQCYAAGNWKDVSALERIEAVDHLVTHQLSPERDEEVGDELELITSAVRKQPDTLLGAVHLTMLAMNQMDDCIRASRFSLACDTANWGLDTSLEYFGVKHPVTAALLYGKAQAIYSRGAASRNRTVALESFVEAQGIFEAAHRFLSSGVSEDSILKHDLEAMWLRALIEEGAARINNESESQAPPRNAGASLTLPALDEQAMARIEELFTILKNRIHLDRPELDAETVVDQVTCYANRLDDFASLVAGELRQMDGHLPARGDKLRQYCDGSGELLELGDRFRFIGNNRALLHPVRMGVIAAQMELGQDKKALDLAQRTVERETTRHSTEWHAAMGKRIDLHYRLGQGELALNCAEELLRSHQLLFPGPLNREEFVGRRVSLVQRSPEDHLAWSIGRLKECTLKLNHESSAHFTGVVSMLSACLCGIAGQTNNLESWLVTHDRYFSGKNGERFTEYLSRVAEWGSGPADEDEDGDTLSEADRRPGINWMALGHRGLAELYRADPDYTLLGKIAEVSRKVRENDAHADIDDRKVSAALMLVEARYQLWLEDYAEAIKIVESAYEILEPLPDCSPFMRGSIEATRGVLFAIEGDLEMSDIYLEKALDNLSSLPDPTIEQVAVLEHLAKNCTSQDSPRARRYQTQLSKTRNGLDALPALRCDF